MLYVSKNRRRCGERPKWREARAEARAVASVVGREALRECVHQLEKHDFLCGRESVEGVVCQWRKSVLCERLKVRNVPRHVP